MTNARRAHIINEHEQQVNIEVFNRISDTNNVRIAFKRVKNKFYYLILNYFMQGGVIKLQIKKQTSHTYLRNMLQNKN